MDTNKYYAGIAARCKITEPNIKALSSLYNTEELESIFNILAITQFKKPKRKAIAEKIRTWLHAQTHLTSRPITPFELALIKVTRTPAWLLQLKQTSANI